MPHNTEKEAGRTGSSAPLVVPGVSPPSPLRAQRRDASPPEARGMLPPAHPAHTVTQLFAVVLKTQLPSPIYLLFCALLGLYFSLLLRLKKKKTTPTTESVLLFCAKVKLCSIEETPKPELWALLFRKWKLYLEQTMKKRYKRLIN